MGEKILMETTPKGCGKISMRNGKPIAGKMAVL